MSTAAITGNVADTSSAPQSAAQARQPLDEVMLAMDVVDTLRRRERMVRHALDVAGREEDLKSRLKKIYQAQGIEVSDSVIESGVRALREDRFVYTPPDKGLHVRLAHWYVTRHQWGKWVLALLVAVVLAGILFYVFVAGPNRALPGEIAQVNASVQELAATESARAQANSVYQSAQLALQNGNGDAARAALTELEAMEQSLNQEYTLRIVNEAGAQSGVWRIPDLNSQARNFYIIVEAVTSSGKYLSVPIKNEETGDIAVVKRWGLRVDEATFQQIAADKQDNGIIENNTFGFKQRGYLQPDYQLPTSGGAITDW